MNKVTYTKHRSVQQMKNMAHNLREKLGCYCAIDFKIDVDAHECLKEVKVGEKYQIYVSDGHSPFHYNKFETWEELIQGYKDLMEE